MIWVKQTFKRALKPNKSQHWSIMDNFFNNTSLVNLIIKWRKHLVVITIVAAILGAIFSGPFFITPLFKSEAIAYPANIMSNSDESVTEQMLQVIQGQDIKDSLINKFNLLEVYKVDPNYKYMYSTMMYFYSQNVKIKKTPYDAVSITVRDKDPERAAAMVNEILRQYDLKQDYLHKIKFREVNNMYQQQLKHKKATMDSIQERMMVLGTEYGLVDFSYQSQEVMRGYLRTITGGAAVNSKAVEELRQNLGMYGGEMLKLTALLEAEAEAYANAKLDSETSQRFLDVTLSYSNIISKPYAADKKIFPVRWVIVLLSAVGAALLSVLVLFIVENRHKLTSKQS